jgi:hypothetical protein
MFSSEGTIFIAEITGFGPRPESYGAAFMCTFVTTVPSLINATAGRAQEALGMGRRSNMRMFPRL